METITRIFDASSPYWHLDIELNKIFLSAQKNYFAHIIRTRGHLFLNEVFDDLGFERTRAGQRLGWVDDGTGVFDVFEFRLVQLVDLKDGFVIEFKPQGDILHVLKER